MITKIMVKLSQFIIIIIIIIIIFIIIIINLISSVVGYQWATDKSSPVVAHA